MIILSKDKINNNFNISDEGIITDIEGNIQNTYLQQGREMFKGQYVHKIQMYTKIGYKDGKIWSIHHLDENKLNNNIDNLIYITKSEHMRHHRANIIPWNKGKTGIYSEETQKKWSNTRKNMHWKKDPITGKRIYY